MTFLIAVLLLIGAVAGFAARPLLKTAYRRWKKIEATPEHYAEAEKAAYEKGKAETLSVLVDTDENAAIIEAIGTDVLQQKGVEALNTPSKVLQAKMEQEWTSQVMYLIHGAVYKERGWHWNDAALTRAGLTADGPTPRAAYRSYLAQRDAAKAIGEQLDELERVGEEAIEDDSSGNPKFAQSMDARVWAQAWLRIYRSNPGIAGDEDTMTSWFANAIMRGFDEANRRAAVLDPPSALDDEDLCSTCQQARGVHDLESGELLCDACYIERCATVVERMERDLAELPEAQAQAVERQRIPMDDEVSTAYNDGLADAVGQLREIARKLAIPDQEARKIRDSLRPPSAPASGEGWPLEIADDLRPLDAVLLDADEDGWFREAEDDLPQHEAQLRLALRDERVPSQFLAHVMGMLEQLAGAVASERRRAAVQHAGQEEQR